MGINKFDINDYFQGDRKGKDAHELEKKALNDPFLSEALEGYEMFDSAPLAAFDDISNRIIKKRRRRRISNFALSLVSGMIAVFVAVFFFYRYGDGVVDSGETFYADMEIVQPIDIFIPDDSSGAISVIHQGAAELNSGKLIMSSRFMMSSSKDRSLVTRKSKIASRMIVTCDTIIINKKEMYIDILMPTEEEVRR